MDTLRNVLGSFINKRAVKRGAACAMQNKTINKPTEFDPRKVLCGAWLLLIVGVVLSGPVAVWAQTAGTSPTFDATVQGESASTVEGTLAQVVNYVGNVLCPIGAGLMVAATVVQVKNGKSWMPTGLTAMGLLGVSGITRLMEGMVTNGQAAVK